MTNAHATKEGAHSALIQHISDHAIAFALVESSSATASDDAAGVLENRQPVWDRPSSSENSVLHVLGVFENVPGHDVEASPETQRSQARPQCPGQPTASPRCHLRRKNS